MAFSDMDISLTAVGELYQLQPRSVHGMLWLQTHFETSSWKPLSIGAVRLNGDCSDQLCSDATAAGLDVRRIPALHSA